MLDPVLVITRLTWQHAIPINVDSPLHLRNLDISSHVLREPGRTRIDKITKTRGGVRYWDQVRDTYTALTPPQPYVKTLSLVRALPPPPDHDLRWSSGRLLL